MLPIRSTERHTLELETYLRWVSRLMLLVIVDGLFDAAHQGHDLSGTMGVHTSHLVAGYSSDVLFENLELIRTVTTRGLGRICKADEYGALAVTAAARRHGCCRGASPRDRSS